MHFPPALLDETKLHTWIKTMLFQEKTPGRYVVIQGNPTWPAYMKKPSHTVFGPCGPNPSPSLRVYRMSDTFPPKFTLLEHKSIDYMYLEDFQQTVRQQYGRFASLGHMCLTHVEEEHDMFSGVGIGLEWKGEADEDYDETAQTLTENDFRGTPRSFRDPYMDNSDPTLPKKRKLVTKINQE